MYTYVFSVNNGFALDENIEKIRMNITRQIMTDLYNISGDSNIINITFSEKLNRIEEQIMSDIIKSIDYVVLRKKDKFTKYTPNKLTVGTFLYEVVAEFTVDGTNTMGTIDFIEIVANKDTYVESYNVKVINRETGYIICEKSNIINNALSIIDLGALNNLPKEEAIFEVQVKKNGGYASSCVYIDSIVVYYGNEAL